MSGPRLPAAFLVASLGIATYSVMDAFMKGIVRAIGVYDAMLWRALAGCVLSGMPYLLRRRGWPARPVLAMHLLRGVLMAAMALLFFWGLARVPMAQAVALTFISPLLSLGLAALLLKERIGATTLLGSLVALAGVVVILAGQASAPPGADAGWGTIAVLVSAVCYAFNIILMRRQALAADPLQIAFFQNLVFAATLAPAAPLLADPPGVASAPAILAAAALAFVSTMLMAWAYARAEASYLSATEYTAFLWAALFGFLVYGERVSMPTLAGAALIVAGCLAAMWRRPPPPLANAEAAV